METGEFDRLARISGSLDIDLRLFYDPAHD
jgi:hypothetical protein